MSLGWQTEKAKLLRKCLECSDPDSALRLVTACGLKLENELKKAGLQAPAGFSLELKE